MEKIETFLEIPKHKIGRIGQSKCKLGKQVTVAMIQSLSKELEKPDSQLKLAKFGTILIDECHHIPAETFYKTLAKLPSYYLYGFTATPFRKYNEGSLIFIHLGNVIAEVKSEEIISAPKPKIFIRNTELDIPFNSKTDQFETLSKILIHDSARNKLILKDIHHELNAGKKVVILTERREHIESLNQYLKQSYETVTLSGEDSESSRQTKWKVLKKGSYQVLITTGQFFGEGSDLQNVNCLFLVYPFSFEGKLIQYIGRVQRSEVTPTIYDYRDIKIDYLNRMFLKRNTWYRKIDRQATLFDDPIEDNQETDSKKVVIDKKVSVPFNSIEFRYGSIAFKLAFAEVKQELEFDIENLDIRPEFEVLKPYFAKMLKKDHITAKVYAEFENGVMVSQIASSEDAQRLNKEIIEGVKFRYFFKKIEKDQEAIPGESNFYNIEQLQNDQANNKLFDSGEELLQDLLKYKKYKHTAQLYFLAERHAFHLLKLRFVLKPFSFVFLLTGNEGYHIVLETLDTEEATYIWHFDNTRQTLPQKLKQVDQDMNTIKNIGRQEFLKYASENFRCILHDYSDSRKGFLIWKSMLEERLY